MAVKNKTLVLGIGNILMGDDGLGVRFAMAFKQLYYLEPGVEVVDGATGGLALLELIQNFTYVIVIDAVNADRPPGSILRYGNNELINARSVKRPTAHQIGLVELLKIANFTGRAPEVTLIGVVPEKVTPATALSSTIENQTQPVVRAVADELRRLGKECKARPLPNA